MLPYKSGGRTKSRGRGGLRGIAAQNNASRPRNDTPRTETPRNDTRKVRFASQDGSTTPPSAPRGRGDAGAQRASKVLPRDPGRIHAALSKSFDNQNRAPSPLGQARDGSFSQRYQVLKENRETERAQAIANGFLADPDRPRTLAEAITPVGTCQDMCAEFERLERIVQNDVWSSEYDHESLANQNSKPVPAESRMVKKFRRAAAGIDEQLPSDLRPPHILQKTLDYLFEDIIGQSPLATVHHFVWDRTRAIRNDFSIQQVTKVADLRIAIHSYERIARFHILSLHQLALQQKPYEKYDSQQEREQLDKTLLSLMQLYDDSRAKLESPNEAEFRAYCIIFQIQDPVPDLEDRVQAWPRHVFRDARVQRALNLYAAATNTFDEQGPLKPRIAHPIAQANWRRFWRIVGSNEISYLMACVAEIYFGLVRRTTLNSIWQAYRASQSRATEDWTVLELGKAFCMKDEEEIRDFCGNFGFAFEERPNDASFINLNSVTGKKLPYPAAETHNQRRSELVERKRHYRTFPAVINGLSVQSAKEAGFMEESSELDKMEEERSKDDWLFIKDSNEEKSDRVEQQPSRAGEGFAKPTLNPFATTFDPLQPAPPKSSFSTTNIAPFGSIAQTPQGTTSQQQPFQNPFGITPAPTQSPANVGFNFSSSTALSSPVQTPSLFPSNPFVRPEPANPTEQSSSLPPKSSFFFNAGSTTTTPSSDSSTSTTKPGLFNARTPHKPSFSLFPPAQPTPTAGIPNTNSSKPATSPSLTTTPFQGPSTSIASLTNKPTASAASTSPFSVLNANNNQTSETSTPPPFQFKSAQPTTEVPSSNTTASSPSAIVTQPNVTPFNFGQPADSTKQSDVSSSNVVQGSAFPAFSSTPALFPKTNLQPSSLPAKTSAAGSTKAPTTAASSLNQSNQSNSKRQRSAESIAASKAKASIIMTRYARTMVEEPHGLLEQLVEYLALPMIRNAQAQVEAERLNKEADGFRQYALAIRYGKQWREMCRNRRFVRQRRERRARHAKALEAQARQSRESSILSQLDAFREAMSSSMSSVNGSPAPGQQSNFREAHNHESLQQPRSISRSPPRERLHPSRQTVPTSAESGSSLGDSPFKIPNKPSAGNERFLSSTSSFGASKTSLRSTVRRTDTTRSTWFKLKAMGLDPSSDTLFSSTATPKDRKRPQGDDFDTSPIATKKPFLQSQEPANPVSNAFLQPNAIRNAINAEDEKLFAALRRVREAMAESEAFYKEEIAKEQARTKQVNHQPHSSSLKNAINTVRHEDWQRASTTSMSSSMSKNLPPKYRNRVSKFLPRDRYADVFQYKNEALLGRSWPRPRPTLLKQAQATEDAPINHNHVQPVLSGLHREEASASPVSKPSQLPPMLLSSDEPEAFEEHRRSRTPPQATRGYSNGVHPDMREEVEEGDAENDEVEQENEADEQYLLGYKPEKEEYEVENRPEEERHEEQHYLEDDRKEEGREEEQQEEDEPGQEQQEQQLNHFHIDKSLDEPPPHPNHNHDDSEDDEGSEREVHYHAPAPIHLQSNRFGVLDVSGDEDEENSDEGEESEDVDRDDGMDGFDDEGDEEYDEEEALHNLPPANEPRTYGSRNYASEDGYDDEEEEEGSMEEEEDDYDDEDDEMSSQYHLPRFQRAQASAPARSSQQQDWGGKSGASVEDAIEL